MNDSSLTADDRRIAEDLTEFKQTHYYEAVFEVKNRMVDDLTKKMIRVPDGVDRGRIICSVIDTIHGVEDFFRLVDLYVEKLKQVKLKEKQ